MQSILARWYMLCNYNDGFDFKNTIKSSIMKTIFTLLASAFITVSAFATERPVSSIMIKSAGRSDIAVVLDGKTFQPGDNSIVISGLMDGLHTLKVLKVSDNRGFSFSSNRSNVLYNGQVSIKRSTSLKMTIERNGRASFEETRIAGNGYDGGYNGGYDNSADNNGQWSDYDSRGNYAVSMSERDFSNVLQNINKEWLESNKMKSASQIISTNSISVVQVKRIMSLFSFEANKLEIAKQAYRNTVDKGHYDDVVDMLAFENNKYELERFMRTSR